MNDSTQRIERARNASQVRWWIIRTRLHLWKVRHCFNYLDSQWRGNNGGTFHYRITGAVKTEILMTTPKAKWVEIIKELISPTPLAACRAPSAKWGGISGMIILSCFLAMVWSWQRLRAKNNVKPLRNRIKNYLKALICIYLFSSFYRPQLTAS